MYKILQWVPPFQPTMAVAVSILFLTLMPQPLGPEELPFFKGADKVAHLIMFGSMTAVTLMDITRSRGFATLHTALAVAAACVLAGAAVEWLQWAMHMGRSGNDWHDALANTAGVAASLPVCRWLKWWR